MGATGLSAGHMVLAGLRPENHPPTYYAMQDMGKVRWAVLLVIFLCDGIGLIYLAR